jgi:hypothetical protein
MVSITTFITACNSENAARTDLITELQMEALDQDTAKIARTQGAIDSLLKRVDKEYAITDDHDTKMLLISQRSGLESANLYNNTKILSKSIDSLSRVIRAIDKSDNEIKPDPKLHIDPGRKS